MSLVRRMCRALVARASLPEPTLERPVCQICNEAQLREPSYMRWRDALRAGYDMNRKIWEWVYIARALEHAGALRPGMKGLGFGVGKEPLVAAFAALGCEIVATDLPPDEAVKEGWQDGPQYIGTLEGLNPDGLCPEHLFRERVSFRFLDMRRVSELPGQYDFLWSSCALEHLGTLEAGLQFIHDAMPRLKPGGIAVHTTEFNLSSDVDTPLSGETVIYRESDVKRLAKELRAQGHVIELNLTRGRQPKTIRISGC